MTEGGEFDAVPIAGRGSEGRKERRLLVYGSIQVRGDEPTTLLAWILVACAGAVFAATATGCADERAKSCGDGLRWAERGGETRCWRVCGAEPGCRSGERCQEGLCVSGSDAGGGDAASTSCGEGERRVYIDGQATCASTCRTGEACASDERCFEGVCVGEGADAGTTDISFGGGGESCEPGDCGPGEACIDDRCRVDPDDGCPRGADRISYRGRTGCRARCSSNSECAGDSVCRFEYCLRPDNDEDGCEPHADPVESEGETACRDGCVRDRECTRLQSCRDGYCMPE